MPDTGASQTIVSADVARDARLLIRPTQTELRNASGTIMSLLGEADAVLCNERHSATSTVLVATHINHSALVSWQDLQKLCVIPKSFPGTRYDFEMEAKGGKYVVVDRKVTGRGCNHQSGVHSSIHKA